MTATDVDVDVDVDVATRIGRDLQIRWPAARPFLLVGSALTLAGGVVAAATRPTDFELGSWLAAFLVLVGGVAQVALGAGQAWMADPPPSSRGVAVEITAWNAAVLLTAVGTLASRPAATVLGAVAMVVAVASFLVGVRATRSVNRWAIALYRFVAVVILVSTPIGLVLTFTRHG